jgi:hypothetical protein
MRTGAMMRNDWKSLRVGDRVRILRLPTLWNHPNYHVDPSTRRLYRRLIARKRLVRVFRIDEFGQPWIQGRAPARVRMVDTGHRRRQLGARQASGENLIRPAGNLVHPPGIEPGSVVPETAVLSVELWVPVEPSQICRCIRHAWQAAFQSTARKGGASPAQ